MRKSLALLLGLSLATLTACGQAPGDFKELVLGRVVHQTLEEVEADAANAAFVHRVKVCF